MHAGQGEADKIGAAEHAVAEEPKLQHRFLNAKLHDDKRDEKHDAHKANTCHAR